MQETSSCKKSCVLPLKSGRDELPLAINAHHQADKQFVPIVERSWLHVVLIGLDHVLGVEALQTRHLIACIATLLRHLHLQCFGSWNISLTALTLVLCERCSATKCDHSDGIVFLIQM